MKIMKRQSNLSSSGKSILDRYRNLGWETVTIKSTRNEGKLQQNTSNTFGIEKEK